MPALSQRRGVGCLPDTRRGHRSCGCWPSRAWPLMRPGLACDGARSAVCLVTSRATPVHLKARGCYRSGTTVVTSRFRSVAWPAIQSPNCSVKSCEHAANGADPGTSGMSSTCIATQTSSDKRQLSRRSSTRSAPTPASRFRSWKRCEPRGFGRRSKPSGRTCSASNSHDSCHPSRSSGSPLNDVVGWLSGTRPSIQLQRAQNGDLDPSWSPPKAITSWHRGFPLELLRYAGANRFRAEVDYRPERGRSGPRIVEPYSLRRTRDGNIVLFVVNDLRQLHSYRIDGIAGIRPVTGTLLPVNLGRDFGDFFGFEVTRIVALQEEAKGSRRPRAGHARRQDLRGLPYRRRGRHGDQWRARRSCPADAAVCRRSRSTVISRFPATRSRG